MYLEDIPLPDAISRLDLALNEANLGGVLGQEKLTLDKQVLGRTLAEPVWAKISSPHYHASAMDGFAVRAADLDSLPATLKVVMDIPAGATPEGVLGAVPLVEAEAVERVRVVVELSLVAEVPLSLVRRAVPRLPEACRKRLRPVRVEP